MFSKNLFSALALTASIFLPLAGFTTSSAHADRAEIVTHRTQAPSKLTNLTNTSTNKVRATRIVSRKGAAKTTKGGSSAIRSLVSSHARAAGVPVSTALAIVSQESGFRPNVTGSAGEIGLMQLKCQTARGMGYRGSCKGLYNPSTNLRYGMIYLRKALNRGSVGYYNAGIHAKRLPKAAQKYAASVARKGS